MKINYRNQYVKLKVKSQLRCRNNCHNRKCTFTDVNINSMKYDFHSGWVYFTSKACSIYILLVSYYTYILFYLFQYLRFYVHFGLVKTKYISIYKLDFNQICFPPWTKVMAQAKHTGWAISQLSKMRLV